MTTLDAVMSWEPPAWLVALGVGLVAAIYLAAALLIAWDRHRSAITRRRPGTAAGGSRVSSRRQVSVIAADRP